MLLGEGGKEKALKYHVNIIIIIMDPQIKVPGIYSRPSIYNAVFPGH